MRADSARDEFPAAPIWRTSSSSPVVCIPGVSLSVNASFERERWPRDRYSSRRFDSEPGRTNAACGCNGRIMRFVVPALHLPPPPPAIVLLVGTRFTRDSRRRISRAFRAIDRIPRGDSSAFAGPNSARRSSPCFTSVQSRASVRALLGARSQLQGGNRAEEESRRRRSVPAQRDTRA